jgi:hypothetical protein
MYECTVHALHESENAIEEQLRMNKQRNERNSYPKPANMIKLSYVKHPLTPPLPHVGSFPTFRLYRKIS